MLAAQPFLDLGADAAALTGALVDLPSVSGQEAGLADAVVAALGQLPGLSVQRDGNVVLATTDLGRAARVVLAGHLDTVPVAGNLPSRRVGDRLLGCGSTDMKAGLAVMLRLARLIGSATISPTVDVTFIFYDGEEVAADRNGLGRLARERPELLAADFAVLLEPTDGVVEAGCQGTVRATVQATGRRAHAARSWLGSNAIHALAPVLQRLADYQPRQVTIDGLVYREGMNAVDIAGGVATNVIADQATMTVNFRYAPDRSVDAARSHLLDMCAGPHLDVTITDAAPAAQPGLTHPFARAIVGATAEPVRAKLGWTDVARFAQLGIPALNLGPGDPNLAHTREESVEIAKIELVESVLIRALTDPVAGAPAAERGEG